MNSEKQYLCYFFRKFLAIFDANPVVTLHAGEEEKSLRRTGTTAERLGSGQARVGGEVGANRFFGPRRLSCGLVDVVRALTTGQGRAERSKGTAQKKKESALSAAGSAGAIWRAEKDVWSEMMMLSVCALLLSSPRVLCFVVAYS